MLTWCSEANAPRLARLAHGCGPSSPSASSKSLPSPEQSQRLRFAHVMGIQKNPSVCVVSMLGEVHTFARGGKRHGCDDSDLHRNFQK